MAQHLPYPQGKYYDAEQDIFMQVDFRQASISVPGYDFLGRMQGYLRGNVYGVWFVSEVDTLPQGAAKLILASDLGDEAQTLHIQATSDSTFTCRLVGGVVMKKVVNRKLVKIPDTIYFTRQRH